jgi:preprotein translocase subunit SecG
MASRERQDMYTLFIIIHILVSLVLCVAVLMQQGKGGGLAGAFGGGGGAPQQLLGSRGMSTLLHKVTIWCGIGFMVTSLTLFMMSGSQSDGARSVLQEAQQSGELGGGAVPTVPTEEGPAPIEVPAGGGDGATDDQSGETRSDGQQ